MRLVVTVLVLVLLHVPEVADPAEPLPRQFGAREAMHFNVHGGGGVEAEAPFNPLYFAGVSFSRSVAEHLSLDLGVSGFYFHQQGTNAFAPNASLLFRWHLLSGVKWSLYIDGGSGVLWGTADVPPPGSQFNFTLQGGVGVGFDAGEDERISIGTRWHHVSNGGLAPTNPGRNSLISYVGWSLPL